MIIIFLIFFKLKIEYIILLVKNEKKSRGQNGKVKNIAQIHFITIMLTKSFF